MKTSLRRREALRLLLGGTTCLVLPSLAQGLELPETLGCALPDGELTKVAASTYGFSAVSDQLIDSTGDSKLDAALGKALVRLAGTFGERPGFGFYNDFGAPNAKASSETMVTGTWGTVIFGQTMFRDLLTRNNDQGMAVLAVAAHEFGHVAQFRSGMDRKLLRNQSTVKRVELHADYLAGYFLGVRKKRDPSISVWAAGHAIYKIGDYQFNNPNHHGTPEERIAAAESGYALGIAGQSYPSAFKAGAEYVLANS